MTDLAWIAAFVGLLASAVLLMRLFGDVDGERS